MIEEIKEENKRLGNTEVYDLLINKEISWQSIIYDLVNTEQLDPWDLDLGLLARRYLEKIHELEEANFFISSKVLLAASVLLRLKSEILLHKYIKSIDEILFGKKEETKHIQERIYLDNSELPILYPKTPLPRYKRVSLQELMNALDQAISTENRRIKKEVYKVQQEKSAEIVLPKSRTSVKDRIKKLYSKIITSFKKQQRKISYSELTGNSKEEKIACFLPVLHLDNQYKIFLEQTNHFDEIWIWLYKHYKDQQIAVEGLQEEIVEQNNLARINQETGFDNPLANFFNLN